MYYGVYCGNFAVLWAITNWDRLEFLFQTPDAEGKLSLGAADWASFNHSGLVALQPLQIQRQLRQVNWRYVAALALAWITFSVTFTVFGLLWGANMERSFVLYYGAPIAFTLVDCAWFFLLLPRARRSLWTFLCMGTLNVLLCMPILLLFVPTVLAAVIVQHISDDAGRTVLLWMNGLIVPTSIGLLFGKLLAALLPRILRRAGLLGMSVSQATMLHIKTVFEASLVMRVFGDSLQVVGVIFLVSAFFTVSRLRDAHQDPDALYLSWMAHLPGLAAPIVFLVHTTVIRMYVNRDKYFIYRCSSGIDWEEKMFLMLAILLVRLALLQLELFYCLWRSRRDIAMVLRGGIESLWKHLGYVTLCIAFASTLFTSCFIIMHDGLNYLFVDAGIEPHDCLEIRS